MLRLSAALFALAVASAGCDEKKAGAIKSSCNNIKTVSTCTEYDDKAFALGEGFVKGACEATRGKYAAGTCPTDKLLGTCAIDGGQFKKYYADGTLSYKADDAAKDCKDLSNGKWAAK